MPPSQVTAIMRKDIPSKIDRLCFEALSDLMADADWYLNESEIELTDGCALPVAAFQEVFI